MLSKNDLKLIKQICERLPVVNEQTISGFDIVDGISQVNHKRRIRKAYERLGMEGVKQYLISIQKLKDGQPNSGGSDIHAASA